MADVAAPAGTASAGATEPFVSKWTDRYRGATVEDLEPPAALSLTPSDTVGQAINAAFERDFTHLTVVDGTTRALLGYVSMPQLQRLLAAGQVAPDDKLGSSAAMTRFGFRRQGRAYRVITMQTPLEQLEAFFAGAMTRGEAQQFAVITDERRRFVLGVATAADLEEFVKRRPA
ncbi:cystathionine beta-synthase [Sporothrix schenckii 1099-18]|uniref:Cystathionine beta-synthase n=3 Tax=Sporothrix TaxID=29907 RepID=U7PW60_SPOS1|nr:cystathionine beta-synthase [Sporothrix schenckii 1099-18]XP_040619772.1 cystathionine beta-synthase [Sporothrix brasiliensis 5110]ERS99842.1 hypothetical protein HMPREF1624_03207 [Sporothrix schenckii ATCC 58251]KIH91762.1 cystathionine beta-synthase [Sporothrix brasiliensis 5110]KJR85773.1 cystathionine beta-synthase [Sporothrix schenckii 1099-18]